MIGAAVVAATTLTVSNRLRELLPLKHCQAKDKRRDGHMGVSNRLRELLPLKPIVTQTLNDDGCVFEFQTACANYCL